jgi:hypothetical protein
VSIKAEWFDETRTIIYVEYIGQWTWQEWKPIQAQLIKMMSSVDYKVDYIINMTNSSYPPPGVLYRWNEFMIISPGNLGVVVFVGMRSVLKALVNTFCYVFPEAAKNYPFEFARTVAEADAILTRHREEWA